MPVAPAYPVVDEELHGLPNRAARHFFGGARARPGSLRGGRGHP